MKLTFKGKSAIGTGACGGMGIECVKKLNKVGLKVLSNSIIRSKMKLFDLQDNEIGFITSGGFSPSLKVSIGIGYINNDYRYDKVKSIIRKSMENISVVNLPFIPHKYKRGD